MDTDDPTALFERGQAKGVARKPRDGRTVGNPSDKTVIVDECARASTCSLRALFDLAAVGNIEIEPGRWGLRRV